MRKNWLTTGAAVIAFVVVAHAGGCVLPVGLDDCSKYPGQGCGSSDGGTVAVGCDPAQATGPVDDTCGVFVSPSGDDGNAGTKEKPLKTIDGGARQGLDDLCVRGLGGVHARR